MAKINYIHTVRPYAITSRVEKLKTIHAVSSTPLVRYTSTSTANSDKQGGPKKQTSVVAINLSTVNQLSKFSANTL